MRRSLLPLPCAPPTPTPCLRAAAADYAPPAFQARALQHTNVQLTWDADDDSRKRALSRKLNADELKEDDFKVQWRWRWRGQALIA